MDGFEEVKVDECGIIADQECVLAHVFDDLGKFLLVCLDCLISVILLVAEFDNAHSEFTDDAGNHLNLCFVLGGLTKESVIPDFSNILMDGQSLGKLVFAVDQVWNVGELEAKVVFVLLEPTFVIGVALLIKINSTVLELISNVCC